MTPRVHPLLFAVVLAFAGVGGSCVDPSSSLSVSMEGPEKLPELLREVRVDWDGEDTWTREISCSFSWDDDEASYEVVAFDRSVGDSLDLALTIQGFEGPGSYERDLYQPEPAFVLHLEDGEDLWRFGSDSGGTCSFEVDQRSRSGTAICDDIPIIDDLEVTSSTVGVAASWSCGVLTSSSFY